MCKEINRLTKLAECPHLNKTDRDAIIFILRETGNIKVEANKGFDGLDFSSWPTIPDKNIIRDWVKARKSKGKCIITQTFINSCSKPLYELGMEGVEVNSAIAFAANGGWEGFKFKWVMNAINDVKVNGKVGVANLTDKLNDTSWGANIDDVL